MTQCDRCDLLIIDGSHCLFCAKELQGEKIVFNDFNLWAMAQFVGRKARTFDILYNALATVGDRL